MIISFARDSPIPGSVRSIGFYAFYNCQGLREVQLLEGVDSIGMCAFSGCGALSDVSLPDSVTDIAFFAFADCPALSRVTVGRGSYAEQFCRSESLPFVFRGAEE